MNLADLTGLSKLAELLAETTLAASAALMLVLLLRRPLRCAFGATVAYAAWALVPAAVVAVSLPAATVVSTPVVMTLNLTTVPMAVLPAAMRIDYAPWLLAAWLAGAALMVVRLGWQQRAFRRGLGRLQPRADGLQQAESVAGLPAALGLLRPAIVVPADFDSRYSGEERELMRAHERSHIVRGDLQLNALVALLRSVFWFNPLLHHASRHFRHDQELACDQRVIARHPHARRAYGEAMFKTQLATQQPLPLGCHWAAFPKARSHPLKERIAMLKQPVPTVARWIGGSTLVLTLALGVGFAAWSAQPKREVIGSPPLAAAAIAPTTSAYLGIVNGIALDNTVAVAAPKGPPVPPVPPAPPSAMALPAPPAPPAAIAPPPPAPQPSQGVVEVNRTPAPKYPAAAIAQKIGGMVVLEIDIDATGKPVNVDVVKSEPAGVFDQATVDAVRQWQFKPEIENGKPVPGRLRVPVEFALKKPEPAPSL